MADKRLSVTHACTVWLHYQHATEENPLDRCHQKRRRVLALCSYAAAAVAIGQLQLQLSHIISSLTGFLLPEM